MAKLASDTGILADLARNRLPVIAWTCADDLGVNEQPSRKYNLMDIAAGFADADLAKIRQQLLALPKTGDGSAAQAMLRWFWEFNINASHPPGYLNTQNVDVMNAPGINGNGGCFVQPGLQMQVPGEPLYAPALDVQFRDAWSHIHDQLVGSSPAAPVTFVWNPNVAGVNNENIDAAKYYPLDPSYVDWIAADGYDKEDPSSNIPVGFKSVFTAWYNEFSGNGKPMMIGETGACDFYEYPNDQGSYILSLSTETQNGPHDDFPHINAINYFDVPGSYLPPGGGTCQFSLSPIPKGGQLSGLASFIAVGRQYYFEQNAL